jgi:hypothetical protein
MLFRTRLSRKSPAPVLRSLAEGAKIARNPWRWGPLVRLLLLAVFAIGACIWALVSRFSSKPARAPAIVTTAETDTLIELLP